MKYLFLSCILFAFASCISNQLSQDYLVKYEEWKEKRLSSLTAPDGWTTFVGLQWIPEGRSQMGSSSDAEIRFPESSPSNMGMIVRNGDSIYLEPNDEVEISLDGERVSERTKIHLDIPPQVFQWESLSFYLIIRAPRYGIRMKDSLSEVRMNLKELPYYLVSAEWIKEATFEGTESTDSVTIQDVVGTVYKQRIEGYAVFNHKGKEYKLLLTNGGEDEYFINFSDLSNGDTTYGGGRFMYVSREDEEGKMILDFNKAYSPPCEFTAYATCPIPPKENNLTIAVEAGEKVNEIH